MAKRKAFPDFGSIQGKLLLVSWKLLFRTPLVLLKACPQPGEILPMLVGFASVLVGLGFRPETVST